MSIKRYLLLFSLLVSGLVAVPCHADWTSEWKQTLQALWQDTKAKTQEILDPERYRPTQPVTIGIAYGTEKRGWFEWAVEAFANTTAGEDITIELIPMGSVQGAQALLNKDQRIQVWSPASSLVENLLVEPWEKEYGQSPILSDAPLALTPMVVVMWEDRYQAFVEHYGEINFKTLGQALNEPTGWMAIANKPQWGPFTFGHTTPTKSNSGLMTLVLMGYDYWDLFRGIKAENVMNQEFLNWLTQVGGYADTDISSTGTLMREFLRYGPSQYNAVMVYENLALANLDTAKSRWGAIKVVYPSRSVWNDNPYYILDVPWTSPEQQQAAKAFQAFLLSDEAQRVARDRYLFRPASINLPILERNSAFNALQQVVMIDVPAIRRPDGEVLQLLLNVWRRLER